MKLLQLLLGLLYLLSLSCAAQAQTGTIAGQVTDGRNGSAVSESVVILGQAGPFGLFIPLQTTTTGLDGLFQFSVPIGSLSYVLKAEPPSPFLPKYWPNYPCQAAEPCGYFGPGDILPQIGQTFVADLVVSTPGSISGRVVRDTDNTPIAGINVAAKWIAPLGLLNRSTMTNAAGEYRFDGLPPGPFRVVAGSGDPEYVAEAFDNIPCLSFVCANVLIPTPVTVISDVDNSSVDFGLSVGGKVSGIVQEVGMSTVSRFALIRLHRVNGATLEPAPDQPVAAGGSLFEFPGLPPGSYVLSTQQGPYANEVYDDLPCLQGECRAADLFGADRIEVAPGSSRSVMLELEPDASISGCVTDAVTGAPIQGVDVTAYVVRQLASIDDISRTTTAADGCYRLDYLSSVDFEPTRLRSMNRAGYIDQMHPSVPCLGGSCVLANGSVIPLAYDEDVSGIDLALLPGASISGYMYYGTQATAADGARVEIYTAQGFLVRIEENGKLLTEADGNFQTYALANGTYYLAADYQGRRHVYGALNGPGQPTPPATSGQPIVISNGQSVGNVVFVLDPDALFGSGFE